MYLKEPNGIHENTIAFVTKLPHEFKLNQYVDYDTIFQKAFIDPLENIIKPLGWNTEPQATLEDLFGRKIKTKEIATSYIAYGKVVSE